MKVGGVKVEVGVRGWGKVGVWDAAVVEPLGERSAVLVLVPAMAVLTMAILTMAAHWSKKCLAEYMTSFGPSHFAKRMRMIAWLGSGVGVGVGLRRVRVEEG